MPGPRRSLRLLTALALSALIAAGGVPGASSIGATSAAVGAGSASAPPRAASAVRSFAGTTRVVRAKPGLGAVGAARGDGGATTTADPAAPSIRPWISRPTPIVPNARPQFVSVAAATAQTSGGSAVGAATYRGRNRVWIPALGIERAITFFPCSSSAYPGDRVYRWGCAGDNNVYLFGHAHSVFKPLHDAYVRGRLARGMKVHYANNAGEVSTYAVAWWKVTTPDKGEFAYAAQDRPSLTLQTCVGSKSQYRLIVRLAKVG
jgi:Sortase domain